MGMHYHTVPYWMENLLTCPPVRTTLILLLWVGLPTITWPGVLAFYSPYVMLVSVTLYRVFKKSLCTWWLQYRKLQVMFKVSPASLQIFIETRLTLTPSVIPNSNYVITVSDWNCLKYCCVFLYCNHQVHRLFEHPVASGVPRIFFGRVNKFSWGQRAERTGIWGR
jgi:hypothetical protein